MTIFWMILTFILILSPIIIIHEFGHFWVAKKFGIHVKEFGLGFPPRAKKLFTWQGTDFTLNWLPLGGFVKPAGENDPTIPDGLSASSPKARFWVLAAGSLANFILAAIIFMITFTLYGQEDIVIETVLEGGVAEQVGLQVGDQIREINGVDVRNDWDQISTMISESADGVTMVIGRGDELLTIDYPMTPLEELPVVGRIGVILEEITANDGTPYVQLRELPTSIEDSPALKANLQAGDIFLQVNGVNIEGDVLRLNELISASPDEEVNMLISRNEEVVSVDITPNGFSDPLYQRAGFYPDRGRTAVSIPTGIKLGAENLWTAIITPLKMPFMLMNGEITTEEARPASIVGISQVMGQQAEYGLLTGDWFRLLYLTGLISAGLGLMNLLPIPALDGGRIVFVIIEWLRGGKRIPHEKEQYIHAIGMMILLSLMFLLMFNDIVNPINFGG